MAKAPAEIMREFVRSQNFTSTDEVKDMFKDILQEVMECELSDELGELVK